MKKSPTKAILLKLPAHFVSRLDEISLALGMNRTALIRRSLARDMDYVVAHELQRTLNHQREVSVVRLFRTLERLK